MLVIGAGPAGMMCAIVAARGGERVTVLERNDKIGRKLYITGKGRCNLTNESFGQEFESNIVSNPRFMRSGLSRFDSASTRAFFEESGVPTKVERGNRVYPASDKSQDIVDALYRSAKQAGVSIAFGTTVTKVVKEDDDFVVTTDRGEYRDHVLVIATGGITYQATGSTGDGYKFAREFGHDVVKPVPSLLGLKAQGTTHLAGLSLRNVKAWIETDGKKLSEQFGEMLYTHTGVSGPIVLTMSAYVNRLDLTHATLCVDLKPAVDEATLDERLKTDFQLSPNKLLLNVVKGYLPHALVEDWITRAKVDLYKPCNAISREERGRLAHTLKRMEYPLSGLEDADGGVVTAGGINVKEVNPKTMESKIIPNLYWVGEVLDVDCLTGGYNLQIAFTTGYAAAEAILAKGE